MTVRAPDALASSSTNRPKRPVPQTDRGPGWLESRVELHRRLAFPFACLVFALVAVPIGAQPRRGGRAAGSLIAVTMIAGYYLLFVTGAGLARQGTVPPALGISRAILQRTSHPAG